MEEAVGVSSSKMPGGWQPQITGGQQSLGFQRGKRREGETEHLYPVANPSQEGWSNEFGIWWGGEQVTPGKHWTKENLILAFHLWSVDRCSWLDTIFLLARGELLGHGHQTSCLHSLQ